MVQVDDIYVALQAVKDPEIPVISVVDMGIITGVAIPEPNHAVVTMTPTFVGCPAINYMQLQVRKVVVALGFTKVEVNIDFSTPWSSNRITETGLQQLKDFKLSPPRKHNGDISVADLSLAECPHCGSTNTSLNTPFGPTLCRALHFCYDCNQAFEQFKPV